MAIQIKTQSPPYTSGFEGCTRSEQANGDVWFVTTIGNSPTSTAKWIAATSELILYGPDTITTVSGADAAELKDLLESSWRLSFVGESVLTSAVDPVWVRATSTGHVSQAWADVWNGPTNNVYEPSSAEAFEIVSADANNTLLGTGARTVTVQMLDSLYDSQVISVDLDGTTPVAIPGGPFIRANFAFVDEVGSYGAVEGSPVQIRSVSGSNVIQTIEVDQNLSRRGWWTTRANDQGKLLSWYAALTGGKQNIFVTVELQKRDFGESAWYTVDASPELSESFPEYRAQARTDLEQGSDLRIRAFSTTTDANIEARIEVT